MRRPFFLFLITSVILPVSVARADWPQWRGPERNGVAEGVIELPAELTETTSPSKVWEATGIPSDHDGGHGSVSVADGRLYLSVVWHRDEPTETRKIDGTVLSNLGYRGTNNLPKEVVEKMETDRMNLSRRMRGAALDEYAKKWVEENLDAKTQLSLGSWVASRFKKGKAAIPIAIYEELRTEAGKLTFANQAEMEEWVRARNYEDWLTDEIIAAVPATEKKANDVVMCFNASTGEEIWKFESEGFPSGRSSSSTPAVQVGVVVAALSEGLYCLDAKTGAKLWNTKLEGRRGPASSPLILNGKVYVQQNYLSAFDVNTGEELWKNKDVKGANQSPASWNHVIVCNSANELVGVDAESGETLWKRPGGGDGTPVISGDYIVVSSRTEGSNLIAYQMTAEGPGKLWSLDFLARRYGSSPIIHDGNVYHLGSERHLCVNLETGEMMWEREAQSSISSPIVAGDKLLVYENRGGQLGMIAANPAEYQHLGRAKVGALYCASPALVGKDLFLRTKESVICYRFP